MLRKTTESGPGEYGQQELADLVQQLVTTMRPELYDPLNPADTAWERTEAEESARDFLEASRDRLVVLAMERAAREAGDPDQGLQEALTEVVATWLIERSWLVE